ncbi:MAG: hypothetical protein JWM11_7455 [Planctomycetaceae bacterium]|nr:hypothetical protein [Planctomycetaceae bacterium]
MLCIKSLFRPVTWQGLNSHSASAKATKRISSTHDLSQFVRPESYQLNWICFRCGRLAHDNAPDILSCESCGKTYALRRYRQLLDKGRDIVKYGIGYRRAYEEQFCEHGKIVTWYSLQDPTLVEAAVGAIVSGVVGNFAYDVLKNILRQLYGQIKTWKVDPVLTPDQQPCTQDLDLVFRLIDQESKFTKSFVEGAQDWINDRESPYPQVQKAVQDERLGHQYMTILLNDPTHYVYIVVSGSCFHRRSCVHLKAPRRRIRVKEALASKYRPCKRCKPIESIS